MFFTYSPKGSWQDRQYCLSLTMDTSNVTNISRRIRQTGVDEGAWRRFDIDFISKTKQITIDIFFFILYFANVHKTYICYYYLNKIVE